MSIRRIVGVINWLLLGLVIGVPLFFWKWSLYPYAVPKTALFEALVELIFALWVVLAVTDKRYRPRMTPLAWTIAVYLALLTITAFAGVDPWRSFFSDLERAFGIVAYYHLAALALVVSSLARAHEIPWKKVWYTSFGVSLVTVVIALLQLSHPTLLLSGDLGGGRPGSTFGNPTFLAGYLLFNIFLAGYFALKLKRDQEKESQNSREVISLWIVIIFDISGVFITETRGDILGLFGGILALVALFVIWPPKSQSQSPSESRHTIFSKRSFYIVILTLLIVIAGGVWFSRSANIWNDVPGIDRLKDLTLSGTNSDIVPRYIAFSAAWQGFLARPFTGWGFENFNVVFSTYYNPKILEYGSAESDFDKPHDIFLEELDAGGLLLLLAYLAVFMALAYEVWKLKDVVKEGFVVQFAIAAIVAYLVRSAVIFDTIGPALMLYLVLGWVDGMYCDLGIRGEMVTNKNQARDDRRRRNEQSGRYEVSKPVLIIALTAALIAIYVTNGTALAASGSAWQGHEDLQLAGDPAGGSAAFMEDMATWNVYQWDFIRDAAGTLAQAYFQEPAAISTSTVTAAIADMNAVVNDHPNDAENHYLLAEIYNFTYEIDPQNYLAAATAQEQAALKLSPDRQQIYYDIAKTESLEGNISNALAAMQKAIALDPNVADSHFYYGVLELAAGDATVGDSEIETADTLDPNDPEITSAWKSITTQ